MENRIPKLQLLLLIISIFHLPVMLNKLQTENKI